MSWFIIIIPSGLLIVYLAYSGLLWSLAPVKENWVLRRARRQVRSCRVLATFTQISTACTCLHNVTHVLEDSNFGTSVYDRQVELYKSLDRESIALDTRFHSAIGTPDFREQCLVTLLQAASACSIDTSVSDVVVFEMQSVDEIADPGIRLYIPFVTVAEQLPFTVIAVPEWFHQLVLRAVSEQPQHVFQKAKSGHRPKSFFAPKVFPPTFAVSSEALTAAKSLWEPHVADANYRRFSDAIVASQLV